MTWRRRASPTESTRPSFRVTIWSWRASALPSWISLSFPLLFPLLICPLLGLFLCTPLSAVLLLFFIHLFFVIDSSHIRLSLIGRIVRVHPGGSHRRGRGRGIDSTPSDCQQYSQSQDDQDCAWNHRWCSLLTAIRASFAQVSRAITAETRQKSCRLAPLQSLW
jgi:hypothetical protein